MGSKRGGFFRNSLTFFLLKCAKIMPFSLPQNQLRNYAHKLIIIYNYLILL